jgi:hypothetical protein
LKCNASVQSDKDKLKKIRLNFFFCPDIGDWFRPLGSRVTRLGEIFADWVNVYFGLIILTYISIPKYDLIVHGKSYVLIFTKTMLGDILGDFFSKPSGHPAWQ